MKRMVGVVLALLVSGVAIAETSKIAPTDHDLMSVPDKIAIWDATKALIFGEPIGNRNWPIQVDYGDRVTPKSVQLTCFADPMVPSSCGHGQRQTKVADAFACYLPPEDKDGGFITWYDGRWTCSLSFTHPVFGASEKKAEQLAVTKHAADVLVAIRARRDSAAAIDIKHVATIQAVRVGPSR